MNRWRIGLGHWRRRHRGLLFASLGAAIVVCGLWAFYPQSGPARLTRAVYDVARLFVLNTEYPMDSGTDASAPDATRPAPPVQQVRWAQKVAVCMAVFFGFAAIYELLRDSIHRTWVCIVYYCFRYRHVIVCGAGEMGTGLVRSLRRGDDKTAPVVIVDINSDNPRLDDCRDLGAAVLTGDATEVDTLDQARLRFAKKVFAVCPSDAVNLEIASIACQQALRKLNTARGPYRTVCYCRIADPEMRFALERDPTVREINPILGIRTFSEFDLTARALFADLVTQEAPADDQLAYYVIVGFGRMGQTLALHGARLAHFSNCKRPRMTIIDYALGDKKKRFLDRFPRFCPEEVEDLNFENATENGDWADRRHRPREDAQVTVPKAVEYACEAEFLSLDSGIDDVRLNDRLARQLNDRRVKPVVIVCMDEETDNYPVAIRLGSRLRSEGRGPLRIDVWMPRQKGLADLLRNARNSRVANQAGNRGSTIVVPFGCRSEVCDLDEIERPRLESLAQQIHLNYCKVAESSDTWERLPETFRDSNRLAADHAMVKLAALGYALVTDFGAQTQGASPDDESSLARCVEAELDVLAQMEHNRWLADRLLDGWRYGPERDDARKLRPQICPWESLDDAEKNKDRSQVRGLPNMIRQAGLTVTPIGRPVGQGLTGQRA